MSVHRWIVALLACPTLALAGPPDLDKVVARDHLGTYWGQVAVVHGGELILAQGHGLGDESLRPMAPDLYMDLGSVSKTFTAVLIMELQERGVLSIDAPVSQFFPNAGPSAARITLRHLLTHTSGIQDQTGLRELGFADRDEAVRLAISSARAAPGKTFQYSNAGFVVLAAVAEVATGQPFEVALREMVLTPAGMNDTGFSTGQGLDPKRQTSRRVAAQGRMSRSTAIDPVREPYGWGIKGAGNMLSTANDMAKWAIALSTDAILNETSRGRMWTPGEGGWGLGWQIESPDVTPGMRGLRVTHGGATRGYGSRIILWPGRAAGVIALCDKPDVAWFTAEALARELFPDERLTPTATFDIAGLPIGAHGMVRLEGDVRIDVEPVAMGLLLTVRQGDRARVSLSLPNAHAAALASRIAEVSSSDRAPGDPGAICSIYTAAYKPEAAVFKVGMGSDILRVDVMPSYHGQDAHGNSVRDERLAIILVDEAAGFWPMILMLGPPEVEQLTQALGLNDQP